MAEPSARPTPPWWRRELRPLLEVTALCGLVVTQPLLDVTGRSPDFFLFHGASRLDVLLLVVAYAVLPPLAVWGVGALSGLAGARIRAAVHTVFLGLLLAALAVQVGKHLLPLRGVPLALLALVTGAVGVLAYRRWTAAGQLLRVAAVGPLVFVRLCVFGSPASAVVLPGRAAGAGPGVARAGGPHPPVVMLFLDEFPLVSLLGPDGRIDARKYPNFAKLAAGSTWYRNATGVSGWTPNALPAMLTGRYPARQTAPHYSQYPDNMFTALGGVYDIRAQESITQLCPPSRCARPEATRGGLPVL
ncbi:MAG TPA: sulfatase, partial [Micromonospora sp.]